MKYGGRQARHRWRGVTNQWMEARMIRVTGQRWRQQYEPTLNFIRWLPIEMSVGMCVQQLRACAQFPGCQLRGSRSDDAPGATGTPARRPWALTPSPVRGAGLLGETADSRVGAGKAHGEPGAPCSPRK